MKITYLLLFVSLFMYGCSSKPSATISKINEKAKSGDIQGVYSFFDKPKINEDLTKQIIKLLESDADNVFKELNLNKIKTEAEDIIKLRVWDVIDDEVKKGKDGSLANIKTIKEEVSNKYNATVLVQLENSKQTSLQLSMVNDKWLITGLNLNDVVKNKIFKKLNAKPSLNIEKIKSLEEYIGKYQDNKFHALLKPELQKLIGNEYETLITNLDVAGPIKKEGQYIVVKGNKAHAGITDQGILIIDTDSGILSAAIFKTGNTIVKFSDIKGEDDYPDILKSWEKEINSDLKSINRSYLQELSYEEKEYCASALEGMKNAKTVMEAEFADNGKYPTELNSKYFKNLPINKEILISLYSNDRNKYSIKSTHPRCSVFYFSSNVIPEIREQKK